VISEGIAVARAARLGAAYRSFVTNERELTVFSVPLVVMPDKGGTLGFNGARFQCLIHQYALGAENTVLG
jgi:hypothetical protein